VAAPAGQLYELVADAALAPLVFPGTVHVEWLDRAPGTEWIRIWAVNGATVRRWTSRRRLDRQRLSVTFQQDSPEPPVAFMRGRWQMAALSESRTLVTLSHAYRAVDGEPEGTAWIESLVEGVSAGQLAALRESAGQGRPMLAEQTADLRCPVQTVFARAQDAGGWATADSQVRQATARWPLPDLQLADLVLAGSRSGPRARQLALVSVGSARIAVKDMRPAPPVGAHIGCLDFSATATGTRVAVRELTALRRGAGAAVLAPCDTIGSIVLSGLRALA
jgi:ribosome-associated toxin RatA of RatAB toxin-antitoxin module